MLSNQVIEYRMGQGSSIKLCFQLLSNTLNDLVLVSEVRLHLRF